MNAVIWMKFYLVGQSIAIGSFAIPSSALTCGQSNPYVAQNPVANSTIVYFTDPNDSTKYCAFKLTDSIIKSIPAGTVVNITISYDGKTESPASNNMTWTGNLPPK